MSPSDAAIVLATAAAIDRRTVGESDARVWADLLGDTRPADAVEAVKRHYTTTRDFLYPSDVLRLVKLIRAERVRAAGHLHDRLPAAISSMPDGEQHDRAYLDWLNDTTRRVGDGELIDDIAPTISIEAVRSNRMKSVAAQLAKSKGSRR